MAGKASITVDLSSEQKDIVGICSKRQGSYLAVAFIGTFTIGNAIFKNLGPITGLGLCFVLAFLVAVLITVPLGILAFKKKSGYFMFYDSYLRLKYFLSIDEYGEWGSSPKTKRKMDLEKVIIRKEEAANSITMALLKQENNLT